MDGFHVKFCFKIGLTPFKVPNILRNPVKEAKRTITASITMQVIINRVK